MLLASNSPVLGKLEKAGRGEIPVNHHNPTAWSEIFGEFTYSRPKNLLERAEKYTAKALVVETLGWIARIRERDALHRGVGSHTSHVHNIYCDRMGSERAIRMLKFLYRNRADQISFEERKNEGGRMICCVHVAFRVDQNLAAERA
jgi:hypothetical protein